MVSLRCGSRPVELSCVNFVDVFVILATVLLGRTWFRLLLFRCGSCESSSRFNDFNDLPGTMNPIHVA